MTETLPLLQRRPEEFARANFALVVRRLADDLAFGSDNSLFVGSGLEYASSRPYQPGDPLRALNWRLTARTSQAFVKEYESLKRTCVYIVVDTSASMLVSSTPLAKIDLAGWIAGALGLLAQRRLSPVSIVSASARDDDTARRRKTASMLRHDLWEGLEPLRLRNYSGKGKLAHELREVADRAARASMIIAISDWHEAQAVGALKRAAQRHDCLAIHTVDPSEDEPPRVGFFRGRESETGNEFLGVPRLGSAAFAETKHELATSGVDYLRLRTDQPFIGPLRHFVSARGLKSGAGRRGT